MVKKKINIFCICALAFSIFAFTGCTSTSKVEETQETQEEDIEDEIVEEDVEETDEESTNVIVAGSVDTSSTFSFSVEETIIGLNRNEEPIVVLVGTFTNNSDEIISFSWALEASAMQGGYTLPTERVPGSSDLNYNDIAPDTTIPVILAWKLVDPEEDVTLTVIDSRHYAKEEVYSRAFTIEELIDNTEHYEDSDEIIERTL